MVATLWVSKVLLYNNSNVLIFIFMGKVLIVEDNELNLKLFYDLLTIQKYDIAISKDGLNIIEIAIKEKPDLILMDIQLNGISGIDLIKKIKKKQ